jgi:hypothetical protein
MQHHDGSELDLVAIKAQPGIIKTESFDMESVLSGAADRPWSPHVGQVKAVAYHDRFHKNQVSETV